MDFLLVGLQSAMILWVTALAIIDVAVAFALVMIATRLLRNFWGWLNKDQQ